MRKCVIGKYLFKVRQLDMMGVGRKGRKYNYE